MGSVRGNRALPICVDDDFIGTRTKKKRTRRSPEERIKELQAKIVEIQTRAARKRDPTMTHINASVRAIDKALGTTEDSATRKALEEAGCCAERVPGAERGQQRGGSSNDDEA